MVRLPWFVRFFSIELHHLSDPSCIWRRLGGSLLYPVFGILMLLAGGVGRAQSVQMVLGNEVAPQVGAGKAALVGAMPADQQLNLSIVLPLRNQAQLTSLLSRLYDPSSPDYRHFLSVDQFTQQFGSTADDYQAVVGFVEAEGFTVTGTSPNRLVLSISGTVAQVENGFHVKMNLYQHPTEHRTYYSPDREPSLDLSVPVAHIVGLNNYSLPHPLLVQAPEGEPAPDVTGSGPGGSYLASDMRAAYYGGTTLDGDGQAVGLLEFGGYNLSDVNLTFSNAGQSYSVPVNNVLLDGATGAPSGSDAEEVLDIVQAIGMAPGLSQVRVYIGNNEADILNAMASEDIAKQLSCSWSWAPDDLTTDDIFFQEFAAQGQSFFAASGDSGAFDAAISPFFYPQEDDYVTAVGATHLNTNGAGGSWVSESAWNTTPPGASNGSGSGGGISPDGIPLPSWQSGLATADNGGSITLRNVPDVAMEGDFDNYVCALGTCGESYAGTSFAAPRWAGFMALVNQQAVEAGTAPDGGLGFINPVLYPLAQGANYGSDFHDITVGNNDTRNQPVYFNAVTGYDLVTGWGSANGQSLINDLAGPQVPGFWILASSPAVSLNQGGTSTTTVNVTDAAGFNGDVTLALTSSLPTGVTASWSKNPTSGTSVLTLTADGSAPAETATVTITGTSGNLTATTNISVTVHTPSFALSASPNTFSINQGGSGTSTISVTPQYGFTGNVNLAISGLPSGVTAAWSANPTSGTSVLTLTASNSSAPGNYTLGINGTSGSLTATTSIALAVHAPTFTLYGATNLDIGVEQSGSTFIYVNPEYGFTGGVNLAVSGLPSGVTASFSPNPTTGSSSITVTASATAPVGTYTLTVTGTSGNLSATTTISLGIHSPSFTLSGPGTVDIGQGTSSSANIFINDQYGFTGSVTLSVSGLPAGVTSLWNPNPANSNSLLTLIATGSAPTGQYTVTVTGTSGSLTASTTFTLGVYVPTFTLSSWNSVSIGQGTSTSAYVDVNPEYGFTGSVNLSISGLPSGVTASLSPDPTSGSSQLNLTAGNSASVGQYTLTITGTSGTQTATTKLTLGVFVPTFTLSSSSVNLGQGTSGSTYAYVTSEYGFTGSVSLSVSGLPTGVTASFSPNPTTGNSQLSFTVGSSVAVGQYPLVITGTSGSQTATTTMTLGIYVSTFTLSSSGIVNIGQGSSGTSYVYVYPQYGFTGSVTLAASGLPSGVTAAFSPDPTTGMSTLTLTATNTASLGQYTVTITGTSGTQSATTTLTLGVYVPTFSLYGPGTVNLGQGSTSTSYVSISSQYGFSGNVNLSVTGLPSGVTASFSPNPATSGSTLTLTASSIAALGQYTVTITGASGAQTASVTFVLGIYAQGFTLGVYPNSLTMNEGGSGTATVLVTPQYGFNSSITFSAAGLPGGVTATFSPNPGTTSSTLTLAAGNSATPGIVALTITGTSGSLTESTTINLTINTPSFTLAAAPTEVNLYPGSSENSTIIVVPVNGFTGNVNFAVSGLPSGVTASFSSSSATANTALTLAAGSSPSFGSAALTVTGTSGSLVETVPIALNVIAAPATTSTTLSLSSGGNPVTSISSGVVVTLTAAVSSGSTPLKAGEVNFCNAAATYCDQDHRLGSAQLTGAGTAVVKFIPGMGIHSYRAAFAGTNAEAPSFSTSSNLTVTSSTPTATTIIQSGSPGNYTLTGIVTGQGLLGPTGNVSFVDTSSGNSVLGSATLRSASSVWSAVNVQTPAIGTSPSSIAVGDFNGDGIPDLAVANSYNNTLTILLGNGDGTFTASASQPQTGNYPLAIAVGDFNGDGKADLAVTNDNSSSVTILLGNGDGTFTAASLSPSTGNGPDSIAVGDFNGDGIQDLAVANGSSGTITVLLGNGDGSFSAAALSPQTGQEPKSIVTADFNGDGKLDLAVEIAGSNASVTVLLGNGDGTFASGVNLTTNDTATALAVGDFNGDGKPDLAVTNYYANSLTIFTGNGDGTFTANSTTPKTGGSPTSMAVGDFNGDGKLDVAVSSYYTNTANILLGNGDGTFAAGGNLASGSNSEQIVTGDFNGDGLTDLAVLNYYAATATILTSQLTQTATATATGISPAGVLPHNVDASYGGDSHYKSSVSSTTALPGLNGTLVATVTASPSAAAINFQQPVTVTVTVAGVNGQPIPTGAVTLSSGSYSSQQNLATGSLTFNIAAGTLSDGTDTLTAAYSGDGNYAASSAATSVAISPAAVTMSSLSPASVAPGASATGTLSLATSNIYSGTFNLTCALTSSPSGAQSVPTCAVSPSSLEFSSGGTQKSTVTVSTTAGTSANLEYPGGSKLWGLGGGGTVLAVILMCGIPSRRRRWASMLILFWAIAMVGVIGCGGGGSSGSGGSTSGGSSGGGTPSTTAGTYTFTLTATGAGGTNTATSTTFTFTVQ
jgi:subtilase family serine protease